MTTANWRMGVRSSTCSHTLTEDIKVFMNGFENKAEACGWDDGTKLKKIAIALKDTVALKFDEKKLLTPKPNHATR